jgi:hypothetical protein
VAQAWTSGAVLASALRAAACLSSAQRLLQGLHLGAGPEAAAPGLASGAAALRGAAAQLQPVHQQVCSAGWLAWEPDQPAAALQPEL